MKNRQGEKERGYAKEKEHVDNFERAEGEIFRTGVEDYDEYQLTMQQMDKNDNMTLLSFSQKIAQTTTKTYLSVNEGIAMAEQ